MKIEIKHKLTQALDKKLKELTEDEIREWITTNVMPYSNTDMDTWIFQVNCEVTKLQIFQNHLLGNNAN